MSTSPNQAEVLVIADSGIPTVAISILDCNYQTVVRGVGALNVKLRPGLYIARYATGTNVAEQLFEVKADQESLYVPTPPLSFASPAPLTHAHGKAPAQEELAVTLSTKPAIPCGNGSELFIFVRDLPSGSRALQTLPLSPPHPASGLKLLTAAGEDIFDFSTLKNIDRCAGVNIALDPGSYILRLERDGHDALEQTVVTCAKWQTQVFLPLATLSADDEVRRPDLDNSAIFMAGMGTGFHASAEEATWVEMARTWLARGKPVVPLAQIKQAVAEAKEHRQHAANEEVLGDMLRAKFTNPMLGIYAAHLMVIAPDPDKVLLREVYDNLRLLLGDHPDVTAIGIWLDSKAAVEPFNSPPMLRSSWSILVNHSTQDDRLIPPGSYTLRITGRLWGSGVWLVWRTPPPSLEAYTFTKAAIDLRSLYEYIRQQLSDKSVSQFIRQQVQSKRLTEVETTLLTYIAGVMYNEALAKDLSAKLERIGLLGPLKTLYHSLVPANLVLRAKKISADYLLKEQITRKLGIPYAALVEAATGLYRKFNLEQRLTGRSQQQLPPSDGNLATGLEEERKAEKSE